VDTNQQGKISVFLRRINSELNFAEKFLSLCPDKKAWKEVAEVKKILESQGENISARTAGQLVEECEKRMSYTAVLVKKLTVHAVGHAHIDMNWTWPLDETLAVIRDTFSTVLTLMDRYPEFTFSQSQAAVYYLLEKYYPELLARIKEAVKKKRWEVSSVTWVEADKNLSSGESQIRQILLTKKYFKRIFDLPEEEMVLDFEPDTFGHAVSIPSILAGAGVKYYYHCRGSRGPKLARWVGPDGGEVLVYFEKDSWYIKHGDRVTPEAIGDFALMNLKQTDLPAALFVYGIGDHGGGPTVRDIENIQQASSWPVFPTVIFSSYKRFFSTIEPFREKLPVIRGELNFMFTGCYTSQSEIKKANRSGERYLRQAETYACLASRLDHKFSYPQDLLESAWRKHLFNQFHDILPGSGKPETREYALGQFQEIAAFTSAVRTKALVSFTELINTQEAVKISGFKGGRSDLSLGAGAGFLQKQRGISLPGSDDASARVFVVFNCCPFPRTEVVEGILWDMPGQYPVAVKDSRGQIVVSQLLEGNGHYWGHCYQRLLFLAENVPPLGYRTYVVGETPEAKSEEKKRYDYRLEEPQVFSLENDILRLELDIISGGIKRLLWKKDGLEMLNPGQVLALFRLIEERFPLGWGMTAWLVGTHSLIENLKGVCFSTEAVCQGPLRWSITFTGKIRHSDLKVTYSLDRGSADIRLECQCLWREWGEKEKFVPQLNVIFPLAVKESVRHYEVPSGWLERKEKDMDLPAWRWADICGKTSGSRNKIGLTVYTDSKHGFRAGDNFLSVSLLRSSYDPDPFPEIGQHSFTIVLSPYPGRFQPESCFQKAETNDFPLLVFPATSHTGILPLDSFLLELAEKNVVFSAFKKQEEGNGLIIRFYEVAGKKTVFHLRFNRQLFPAGVRVTETDLLEKAKGKSKSFPDGAATWEIKARGLLTLLVEPLQD